jgi:hypothetical protein
MAEHYLHHGRHRLFNIGIRVGQEGVDSGHWKTQRINNNQPGYFMKYPG